MEKLTVLKHMKSSGTYINYTYYVKFKSKKIEVKTDYIHHIHCGPSLVCDLKRLPNGQTEESREEDDVRVFYSIEEYNNFMFVDKEDFAKNTHEVTGFLFENSKYFIVLIDWGIKSTDKV